MGIHLKHRAGLAELRKSFLVPESLWARRAERPDEQKNKIKGRLDDWVDKEELLGNNKDEEEKQIEALGMGSGNKLEKPRLEREPFWPPGYVGDFFLL